MGTSVTESNFLSVNQSVHRKIRDLKLDALDERRLKFVGYYPTSNKNWAEKALHLNDVNFKRVIPTDFDEKSQTYQVNYEKLEAMIDEDVSNGLIPAWYGGQIGSTDCAISDNLEVLGPILKKHDIYLSVDAAWSGMFNLIEEYRPKGLEHVNTFIINMA